MAGTMRRNRKGFDKERMNMTMTNSLRGDSNFFNDPNNQVSIVQWHDNKIVNVVSTLGSHGRVDVSRRVGSQMKLFTTEKCIRSYQENMGGVDRGDQIRDMGAGFCRKAHFKKWYKKTYFSILDFMLLNSYIAWGMAAGARSSKKNLLRKCDFYACLAEEFIHFSPVTIFPSLETAHVPMIGLQVNKDFERESNALGHLPNNDLQTKDRPSCMVCKLEWNIMKRSTLKVSIGYRDKKFLSHCKSCNVFAHVNCNANNKIGSMEGLRGKSCYEIYHSKVCRGLWGKSERRTVSTSHPVYEQLLIMYGLGHTVRSKITY